MGGKDEMDWLNDVENPEDSKKKKVDPSTIHVNSEWIVDEETDVNENAAPPTAPVPVPEADES